MRKTWLVAGMFALILPLSARPAATAPKPPSGTAASQHDFLTQTEAERIRDAGSANERVGLFLDFAADRLRRFKHELAMSSAGPRQADFLNDLLDAFDACVNSASDRIRDAVDNGENVQKGIEDVKKRVPEFQKELKGIKAQGKQLKVYVDTLDDTMDDLNDDLKQANKAEKVMQATPHSRSHDEDRR